MQDRIRMLTERRREIRIIPVTGHEVNRINVELYYCAGGINYATYKKEERGYWLSVKPEFHQDEGGFTSTMSTAFSGFKTCISPASRFGKAKLAKINVDNELIDTLVQQVVEKNNLTIIQTPIAA